MVDAFTNDDSRSHSARFCPVPINYDIDDGILVIQLRGQVTSKDFADYLEASAADERYRTDLPRLVVMADDATFPPSAEIIAHAGRMPARQLAPNVKFACVATSPLAIGISSMFMGNAGLGANYQLFDDVARAREWLRA